jgi:hypothetical protein
MCLRYKKRSPSISRPEALLLKKEKYKNKKKHFRMAEKDGGHEPQEERRVYLCSRLFTWILLYSSHCVSFLFFFLRDAPFLFQRQQLFKKILRKH